ncbi:OLC1v1026935C1 [Oldenlandia corymbosa var. corymbosa]|uniref:OLC1v1026935C1 n=1 Tax=Oldenlandia corymbosa var. corymbosa TaxID=529605 RepID=A0AAV1CBH2_OLDCO|nr:OLC1v1026935C1 [Oldenlandia corymbosa var. corymbosa]
MLSSSMITCCSSLDHMTKTSIIVDASNYIRELKQKVENLQQDISTSRSSTSDETSSWPKVTVKTLEKGILVNVYSGKSCPGLLVCILEAFEEVGLNVLDARVSCEDNFHLQAIGEENEENEDSINAQVVKQAISDAIKIWEESSNEQGE